MLAKLLLLAMALHGYGDIRENELIEFIDAIFLGVILGIWDV
jgi:hypothetical protein